MPSDRQSGFTLVELMIAIAVVAILLGLALPSFQASMRSNRVATSSNEMLASLSLARTEAIRGLGAAGVCASADADGTTCAATGDWANGWIVWRDDRGSDGVVVRNVVRYIQPKQRMTVVGPSGGVQFTTQGRVQAGPAEVGVTASDATGVARCIRLNASGQSRITQGACT